MVYRIYGIRYIVSYMVYMVRSNICRNWRTCSLSPDAEYHRHYYGKICSWFLLCWWKTRITIQLYQHTFLFDRAWFVLILNWKRENEIGSMHRFLIIITPDICQDIFQLKRRNVEKKLTPRPILGKIGSVAHNVEHFPLKPESSYPHSCQREISVQLLFKVFWRTMSWRTLDKISVDFRLTKKCLVLN